MIEIYWKDITVEKQQEILDAFGENCNYGVFPIVCIPEDDDEAADELI